jgi:hypothetical protein
LNRAQWALFAGLVALLLGVSFVVLAWINRPMGQTLILQIPAQLTGTTAIQPIPTQSVVPVRKTPTVAMAMPAVTLTTLPAEVAKTCGNTDSMRLLAIGLTTLTAVEIPGADAIRLMMIDFDKPPATIMTLPALLWGETPILANLGVEQLELNLVYNTAFSAAKDNPNEVRNQKATQAMA